MNRPRASIKDLSAEDPMERYNDVIKRFASTGTIKSAINTTHGMKCSSEWKSLDANVKRKLKKYGFNKNSELNPTLIACITKKIEKKKLKKGVKSTL